MPSAANWVRCLDFSVPIASLISELSPLPAGLPVSKCTVVLAANQSHLCVNIWPLAVASREQLRTVFKPLPRFSCNRRRQAAPCRGVQHSNFTLDGWAQICRDFAQPSSVPVGPSGALCSTLSFVCYSATSAAEERVQWIGSSSIEWVGSARSQSDARAQVFAAFICSSRERAHVDQTEYSQAGRNDPEESPASRKDTAILSASGRTGDALATAGSGRFRQPRKLSVSVRQQPSPGV
jgi:hypothetical protein